MSFYKLHNKMERNTVLLMVGILVAVVIGGIVEIIPLFTIESTIEKVKGVRPYSPLELKGRQIYIREGCYTCHSQMIRPFRDEVERYGHYSLAAESMYDRPFQWGSKRTGPDLARVGGRYSNEWHLVHMLDPQSVVPESVMPSYGWLMRPLKTRDIVDFVEINENLGVPYTPAMVAAAEADLADQADPDADHDALLERYPGAAIGDFDGDPEMLSEMDAIIAYLQVLGTMVDFSTYRPEYLDQKED